MEQNRVIHNDREQGRVLYISAKLGKVWFSTSILCGYISIDALLYLQLSWRKTSTFFFSFNTHTKIHRVTQATAFIELPNGPITIAYYRPVTNAPHGNIMRSALRVNGAGNPFMRQTQRWPEPSLSYSGSGLVWRSRYLQPITILLAPGE